MLSALCVCVCYMCVDIEITEAQAVLLDSSSMQDDEEEVDGWCRGKIAEMDA